MIPNTETTLAQAGYIQLTGYQSALPTYSPWHYLRNIGTVHHHNASILSAGLVIGLWDCPTISLLWGVVVQKADVELRAETCCKIPPGQDRTPHHHLTSQMLPFSLMSGLQNTSRVLASRTGLPPSSLPSRTSTVLTFFSPPTLFPDSHRRYC